MPKAPDRMWTSQETAVLRAIRANKENAYSTTIINTIRSAGQKISGDIFKLLDRLVEFGLIVGTPRRYGDERTITYYKLTKVGEMALEELG